MGVDEIHAALGEFAEDLTANFAVADLNPAQAEDQLKGPTQRLLQRTGAALGYEVIARTEALTDLGARPDLGISVGQLVVGHIELKAPGKGVQPRDFGAGHDREQFKKLADHPNLLYTDGNEWALYRLGRRIDPLVRATGDVRSDAAAAYDDAAASDFTSLLLNFLTWQPLVPTSPRALAEMLAPLTRLLRENVRTALSDEKSALSRLADEWRDYFFPEADDAHFADAYAQTVTYALLLARVEGERDLHARAAERLDERHGLLAQVLRVIEQPAARREVEVAIDLLERAIEAVDPEALASRARDKDLWLYFYEDFLAAYDKKLRKQSGVYFTPPSVVRAQTVLVNELLRDRFEVELGLAGDDVTVLDPAVGTGTYLLAAIQEGLDQVAAAYGSGAQAARASLMAENLHGFELLIGPYAVATLRVSQAILEAGGALPADGPHVYLTDTLESPVAPAEREAPPLFHEKLAEENERARRVKAEVPILVCIGNPPYFRQVIDPGEEGVERLGGWVRRGDEGEEGILRDFIRDAPGVHVKNLYNLYVYFWRWALWKVFENAPGRGVVSFITASSYLRGPGFAGMRRFMREILDELWILDLGGEGRGARQSENVFAIQTPVAIAIALREGEPDLETPARVRYARIDGTREEKYAALNAIETSVDVEWEECFNGWTEPFLPESVGDFFSWPLLTDIFPWQHSGVQFKRTWPIAPDRQTLGRRWDALLSAPKAERWRDDTARHPNVAEGLLHAIGHDITPEDLVAYCYAVLSAPSYAERFAAELEVPGPHVPITRDRDLSAKAVELGRRLIWLHTYGERLIPEGERAARIPQGRARSVAAVPSDQDHYPESHSYDAEREELHVGEGLFAPVSREVRGYSVSGLDVIGSWLDYRMKAGAGRRSSQLDRIRPAVWPAEFTEELLRLLWIIEHTVALAPELDEILDRIVEGPLVMATELPEPTADERRPPD
jgi:hypothetical protein